MFERIMCHDFISICILDSNPLSISERQRAQKIHCTKRITECTVLDSLGNATCFGNDLGYSSVYLKDKTYWEVQSQLRNLSVLHYVPRCWQNIQSLLCAYYLPKCSTKITQNTTYSSIDMIPKSVCYKAREKCGIINSEIIASDLTKEGKIWPEFLDCENTNLFYENQQFLFIEKNKIGKQDHSNKISCQTHDEIKDSTKDGKYVWFLKFDHTKPQCLSPYLLPSNISSYSEIEGCDLSCKSTQFTLEERMFVSNRYSIATIIALILNLLAVATILIGPDQAVFPSASLHHIVLVMNICCILPNLFNLLITNILGIENVSCRADGK